MAAEVAKPVGPLPARPPSKIDGSREGPWNNVAQVKGPQNPLAPREMPAELTKPIGTLPPFPKSADEKLVPGAHGSKEGPWNNVTIKA